MAGVFPQYDHNPAAELQNSARAHGEKILETFDRDTWGTSREKVAVCYSSRNFRNFFLENAKNPKYSA